MLPYSNVALKVILIMIDIIWSNPSGYMIIGGICMKCLRRNENGNICVVPVSKPHTKIVYRCERGFFPPSFDLELCTGICNPDKDCSEVGPNWNNFMIGNNPVI